MCAGLAILAMEQEITYMGVHSVALLTGLGPLRCPGAGAQVVVLEAHWHPVPPGRCLDHRHGSTAAAACTLTSPSTAAAAALIENRVSLLRQALEAQKQVTCNV